MQRGHVCWKFALVWVSSGYLGSQGTEECNAARIFGRLPLCGYLLGIQALGHSSTQGYEDTKVDSLGPPKLIHLRELTGNPCPSERELTGNPSPSERELTGNPSPSERELTGSPCPS
jgi:hypothetical protein